MQESTNAIHAQITVVKENKQRSFPKNMPAGNYGGQGKIILEANYKNPSFGADTVRLARDSRGRYISGRRWLLFQALAGFRIFTGETPDFRKMSEVL